MALFVTKEGKRKSPMAVTCFFVDLLFCLVFGGMYALLTGVLHDHLPLGGGMAENWIHCGLIAVVGTAVCCILFLLPDKRIVPYSFAEPAGYHDSCAWSQRSSWSLLLGI